MGNVNDPETHFKVDPRSLAIDPSLGIVDTGIVNVAAPADINETGEANVPAAIQTKPMQAKKAFFTRGKGSTLAEQLGTPESVGPAPQPEPMRLTPIDVPGRIAPQVSHNLSADQMSSVFTPGFQKKPKVDNPFIVSEENPIVVQSHGDGTAVEVLKNIATKRVAVPEDANIKADLKGLVLRYIGQFGQEESAKFFDKTPAVITKWVNGTAEPPLSAVQAILDKSPKAKTHYLKVAEKAEIDWESGEGMFSLGHTKEELPVDLCLCTDKDIPPYVMWIFIVSVAQYGIGFKMVTDTVVTRSRNLVAKKFLDGKAQWSIWLDGDILPTTGNAPWWRAITRDLGKDATVSETSASYDYIKRLLSHKQPFVGGVYATRRKGGPLVTQTDLHPRGEGDKIASNAMRKNQAKGLIEVDWLSCGFAAIHRTVFETIRKQHPDKEPKIPGEPFPFFSIASNEGEDVALSRLAKQAGFKLYLDQELVAGHLGRWLYLPAESKFNGVMDFTNA